MSEKVYKYTVPLENDSGSDRPAYEPTYSNEVYVNHYKANTLVVIQDESVPHFHKDDVNVGVEEVNKEDYE